MTETASSRRIEILQAACQEFSEKGFAGAKIEQIARRCGIGKSTVYEYFPSKADLLEETAAWMMQQMHDDVEGIMQSDLPFAAKMREYLLYICGLMQRMGHGMIYMHGDSKELLGIISRCTTGFTDQLHEVCLHAVQTAKQSGELRADIDEQAAACLFMTLPSPPLAEQLDAGNTELAEQIVRLVMQGMENR